jgi:hypothetical protein
MRNKRNGFTTRILPEDKREKEKPTPDDNGNMIDTTTRDNPIPQKESLYYDNELMHSQRSIVGAIPSSRPAGLLRVLLCGCILELLYLVIVALAPLPDLHLSSSPLLTAWPWTLVPSHLLFPGAWASSNRISSSNGWTHLVLLSLTLIAATGVFAGAIWSILRLQNNNNKATTRWLLLLLAGATLFGLTLLVQPALFSDNVFTYIFSGRILAIYHADPLNTAPIQFPADPYLRWLGSGRYTPNIYGPLWLCIASLLVSIGKGPVATLLLFKGVAMLSHLINCILVWAILGKIAPGRRLLGTLLYAWNPLSVIELAGNGQNEGILLSILLLAIFLYVQGKGRWHEIGVVVALGLAMSMNLIVLLIAPLFTWYLMRTERNLPRALWGFCWRLLLGQGLVIPIYLQFWHGASTFFAITSAIDMQYYIHSPVGLLAGPSRWLFGLVAQWSQFPSIMQPTTAADTTLRASAIFIFMLIYLNLFGKVRRATTTLAGMRYAPGSDQEMRLPGFDVLLNSWGSAVFWYLVLIVGWFWPWYVLWALWIVALRRLDARSITLLLLSGTALLIYPLRNFAESPVAMYQSLLVFGIPLVYLLINIKRQTEGNILLHDRGSEAEED